VLSLAELKNISTHSTWGCGRLLWWFRVFILIRWIWSPR